MSTEKYNTFSLMISFCRKKPWLCISIFIASFVFYLKSIVIPVRVASVLVEILSGIYPSKETISILVLLVIVAICGILVFQYLKSTLRMESQAFFLRLFFKKILQNRERVFKIIPSSLYISVVNFSTLTDHIICNLFQVVIPFSIIFIGIGIFIWTNDRASFSLYAYVLLVTISIFLLISLWFVNTSSKYRKELSDLIDLNQDIHTNISSILTHNTFDLEEQNIDTQLSRLAHFVRIWAVLQNVLTVSLQCGLVPLFAWICLRWASMQKKGLLKPTVLAQGVLIFIIVCYQTIYTYINVNGTNLLESYGHNITNIHNINKSFPFLDIAQKEKIPKKQCKTCILQLTDVSATLGDRKVITNINLQFYSGEVYTLVGNIGSGKTTVLRAIYGLILTDDGYITSKGKHLKHTTNKNLREWRENIHYCEQRATLFDRSAKENIEYGSQMHKIEKNQTFNKLKLAKIVKDIEKTDRTAGFGGSSMSGGQRQLIILLRVIQYPKQIVLLDEPTASLDSVTKQHVYTIIDYLKRQGSVVIIATHDPELIHKSDQVIKMEKGRVVVNKPIGEAIQAGYV
jgi:ABC-type bacteriocin/lantibiotic exporter with double-glycine peptidase domain